MASVTGPASAAARHLAARIVSLPTRTGSSVRDAVEQALTDGTVLRLSYTDAAGRESRRTVEPAGLLTADGRWYLIAWCRTRRAGRGFHLDRITAAVPTGERAPSHDVADLLRGSTAADAAQPAARARLTASP
ncbi:helix-turn-helix transcriptional regulator [Streptomyces sp. NPDC051578]|uniref:helix-turn-helix transcriptional regulator n=1 Tax=Streptomyces sp. NPDC051578 TaxID=3365662 RepID=UPI00378A0BD1